MATSVADPAAHPGDQHEIPGYQPHTSALDPLKSRITLHYDLASDYYHRLWGQHIHHGLFTPTITTKEAAQTNLIDHLLKLSALQPNGTVLDVGCGLGGTTRYLAKHRAATVTGITISSKQVEIARRITAEECPPAAAGSTKPATEGPLAETPFQPYEPGQVRYLHLDADLLRTTFPPSSYNTVWISECLSHIPNKPLFFDSTFTLLTPSGTLVLADWFKAPSLTAEQITSDIKPIEDGMLLPGLNTMDEYVQMAETAGLRLVAGPEDLSLGVAKTWDISWSLVSSPALWAYAISQGRDGLAFLQSFRAMRRGYANGNFRYGVMIFEKPT
ncbi:uncharacterized protein HMPREF1541_03622 [Cyphellophora europaea CBS 101466]|uniref:Methyltransferase type 11 domain-containing protein n=1 Tax=Cyphellophora europaea (strain CBS 101466) TaxID=1220924 RepID=W2RYV2_CYPE1|nr:uncharacterized protein HMPREF1541_03622 [Cyphellophora europaea CBS 101466]ETN41686.1 hypothetical protein HMPREF1541_03622 [Cyphellophora europaea CBS 101466]